MPVMYSAGDLGTFKTLLKLRGTMVPMVLGNVAFYLFCTLHAGLLVLARLPQANQTGVDCSLGANNEGCEPMFDLPEMAYSVISTITGLLTFFIVFYGSQCYGRFNTFYGHCVGISGNVMNFVALVRNHFPADPNVQWNATRLLLASMHIQYYTLNESSGGAAIDPEEWDKIIKRSLLKANEIEILKTYTGYKPFLPLVWALAEVEDALLPKIKGANATNDEKRMISEERYRVSDLLSNFRELCFTFRGHCGQINNWLKQPVPFPYFHVLTLLLVLDMSLISYGLATMLSTSIPFAVLVYVVILLAFLGLKEVAVAMSDPFGDDAIDFDLEAMLSASYKNAVALLRDTRTSDGEDMGELLNPITNRDARFTIASLEMDGGAPGESTTGTYTAAMDPPARAMSGKV